MYECFKPQKRSRKVNAYDESPLNNIRQWLESLTDEDLDFYLHHTMVGLKLGGEYGDQNEEPYQDKERCQRAAAALNRMYPSRAEIKKYVQLRKLLESGD